MTAERERIGNEPTSIELRYEVLRTLGQGAAGVVYKVRDRASGETLALKKLLRMDPKAVARLKNEFRALMRRCPARVEASEDERYFDDVERAKRALGRVLGGAEGAAMCARVVEGLSDHGMVDPEREITTHFPELVEG